MTKKVVIVTKKSGGKAKPSASDVKEANKVAEIGEMFPADAPLHHSEGNVMPQESVEEPQTDTERTDAITEPAESTESREETSEQSGISVENEETIDDNQLHQPTIEASTPVEPTSEPEVASVEAVSEQVTTETQSEPSAAESPVVAEQAPPTQEELEEKVIEKWWNSQNKPTDVNHFELAYSSGINMDRFSNLEAKVGKFKFSRSYVGSNWQITVEEK